MKTYRLKTDHSERVKAKVFELGDEDGIVGTNRFRSPTEHEPYVVDLHNREHIGVFGHHYLVIDSDHDRTLIEKDEFEEKYEPINNR